MLFFPPVSLDAFEVGLELNIVTSAFLFTEEAFSALPPPPML